MGFWVCVTDRWDLDCTKEQSREALIEALNKRRVAASYFPRSGMIDDLNCVICHRFPILSWETTFTGGMTISRRVDVVIKTTLSDVFLISLLTESLQKRRRIRGSHTNVPASPLRASRYKSIRLTVIESPWLKDSGVGQAIVFHIVLNIVT
jgi:hypothetical protein